MTSHHVEAVRAEIVREIDRIWLDEPAEITLLRNGISAGSGGSRGQLFSVLVHLEGMLTLLGPHVLSRLLPLAQREDVGVVALRETVFALFRDPFDQFTFLGDLGLPTTDRLGHRFLEGIGAVETREQFHALTADFALYMNRMFRWVYLIFPWGLGAVYPQRAPEDVERLVAALDETGVVRHPR